MEDEKRKIGYQLFLLPPSFLQGVIDKAVFNNGNLFAFSLLAKYVNRISFDRELNIKKFKDSLIKYNISFNDDVYVIIEKILDKNGIISSELVDKQLYKSIKLGFKNLILDFNDAYNTQVFKNSAYHIIEFLNRNFFHYVNIVIPINILDINDKIIHQLNDFTSLNDNDKLRIIFSIRLNVKDSNRYNLLPDSFYSFLQKFKTKITLIEIFDDSSRITNLKESNVLKELARYKNILDLINIETLKNKDVLIKERFGFSKSFYAFKKIVFQSKYDETTIRNLLKLIYESK